MSALQIVVDGYSIGYENSEEIVTCAKEAAAELAQLRAAADELQRIRELIDPLNGQSVYDAVDALLHDESSAEIYKVEIAEQARQLGEAREILSVLCDDAQNRTGKERYTAFDRADAWLATNPAPQVDGNQTASLADYPLFEDRVP